MKPHTREEKDGAMKNLPKPVLDFMGSPALSKIYAGMGKKLELNFRQMMVVSEITNATLMGLEPESALETNLHQWLHELSNEKTRELIADINDRIFKEAKRRLQENIIDSEPIPNEDAVGPTDEEIDSALKEEAELVLQLAKQEKNQPAPVPNATAPSLTVLPAQQKKIEPPALGQSETLDVPNKQV